MLKVWMWMIGFFIMSALTLWGARGIRTFIVPKQHTYNEVIRTAHQLFGLIYGVFLAAVVVFSWQNYMKLSKNLDLEAISLTDVWYDSEVFPKKSQAPFHKAVLDYLQSIYQDEWNAMAQGTSPHSNTAYIQLWEAANRLQVKNDVQKAFLTGMVEELNNVNNYRLTRIFAVKSSIPCLLWGFLFAGAFCMMILTELYNANSRLRTFLVALQALMIGFIFYLIAHFNTPFQGPLALKDHNYKNVAETLIKLSSQEAK